MSKNRTKLTYRVRRHVAALLHKLTDRDRTGAAPITVHNDSETRQLIAAAFAEFESAIRTDEMLNEKHRNEVGKLQKITSLPIPQAIFDDRIPCPVCASPSSLASLPIGGVPPGTDRSHVEWQCDNRECRQQFYAPCEG